MLKSLLQEAVFRDILGTKVENVKLALRVRLFPYPEVSLSIDWNLLGRPIFSDKRHVGLLKCSTCNERHAKVLLSQTTCVTLPVPNRPVRFLAILSVSEFCYIVSARLRIEHLDFRSPFLPNICVWLSEKANRCSTLTRRHGMLKRTHSHFCRTCAQPGLCWPSHFEASLRNDSHRQERPFEGQPLPA
jgi:hypothetical protein